MLPLLKKLIRPNVQKLAGYVSARHLAKNGKIFLDANENSFGSVLPRIAGVELSRYPDPLAERLRAKLAAYLGCHASEILVGNGSDEIIWLLLMAFVGAGEGVTTLHPTFAMYAVFAELFGAKVTKVPLDTNYNFDPKKLLKAVGAKTKVIFLCSPNNPTGNVIPLADIELIAAKSKKLVVVDEAYVEFAPGTTALQLIQKYPNIIILRTFSKAWGLAGLRVGYAVGHAEVIATLAKVRAPYSVDVLSQKLALDALQKAPDMERSVIRILAEREKLALELSKLGLTIFPSHGNFVLVRFPKHLNASIVQKQLAERSGIVIRDFNKPGLKNCARITVGTPNENELLIRALRIIKDH